ncbi:MAG: VOC family protein [Ignavibacteria bacterium]|jgi:predicted enzyme related to lactoylglutathione lyase
MSTTEKPEIGLLSWFDLTVPDAENIRDFYSKVIGWQWEPVKMEKGAYNDYNMKTPEDGLTVTGVCHSRGVNSDLPPSWLLYFTVESVKKSSEECKANGGKVIAGPKDMGKFGKYCVIEDPAGAVCALFEAA